MDQWLVDIENDTSDLPRELKVVTNKPVELVDACWTPYPEHEKIVEEQRFGKRECDDIYPGFPSPRMVAGGTIENDIVACQLKAPDPADYEVTFSESEWDALEAIFPSGATGPHSAASSRGCSGPGSRSGRPRSTRRREPIAKGGWSASRRALPATLRSTRRLSWGLLLSASGSRRPRRGAG